MSEAGQRFPLPVALTMGDPAGIGPEIAVKAWLARNDAALPPFALFADPELVTERLRQLGFPGACAVIGSPDEAVHLFATALPVMPIPLRSHARPGQPDTANAGAVIGAIEAAATAVIERRASAIVTSPIAKGVLYAAGFRHPGHTEFLAAIAERAFGGRRFHPVMMLAAEPLKVVPLTVHIPLSAVPSAITRQLIFETVRTTWEALKHDFAIEHPRIAVTGLNPHAGEGGSLGSEEDAVIAPAVAELRSEGLSVSGPWPADTLFHAKARKTYDAAVAMYHDQALIPLKTLAFDTGVNITLGLPFVRTSPDHGTAFDIAADFRASPDSLVEALKLADAMAAARRAAERS